MTYWFYAKNSFKFLRPFCVKKGISCHYSLTSAHYLLSFQVLCSFKVSAGSGAIWIAWHAKNKWKNNCKQMTYRIYIIFARRNDKILPRLAAVWTKNTLYEQSRSAKRLIRARKTTAKGLRNCSTFALGPISCCYSLSSRHWLHFSPTLSGKSPVSQRNTVNSTKGKLLVISKY